MTNLFKYKTKTTEILNLVNNQYVLAPSFLYLGSSSQFQRNQIQVHDHVL